MHRQLHDEDLDERGIKEEIYILRGNFRDAD